MQMTSDGPAQDRPFDFFSYLPPFAAPSSTFFYCYSHEVGQNWRRRERRFYNFKSDGNSIHSVFECLSSHYSANESARESFPLLLLFNLPDWILSYIIKRFLSDTLPYPVRSTAPYADTDIHRSCIFCLLF